MGQNHGLQGGLKSRHLTMISIGGVIGAGLFVGSGAVINSTGPGALASYALAGLIVVLVMRMLGEMASIRAGTSGSFAAYAREAIGPWAGYTIGWLYWFFWVIVIAIEAIAGAAIIHEWVPQVPAWIISLVLTLLLTLTNIYSVKSFGEFEYWFALIKVVTIIAFLIVGAAMIFGIVPGTESPGTSNLLGRGGFMPNGIQSILLGIVIVIFSFFGAEIAAIAAGESDNPERGVMTAINSVVWRILIFFIGSIAVLVMLLPWDSASALSSPFVTVFDMAGIPAAALVMKIVVLTSVLSCLNAALYTNSRMLYALAKQGDAPRGLFKLSKRGVPARAVWASTFFSYIAAIFHFVSPDKLFLFLVNASGAIALLVYMVITVSHIRLRQRDKASVLPIKMWLFPYLSYAVILVLCGILISMAFIESMRSQFYLTMLLTVLIVISYALTRNKRYSTVNEKSEKPMDSVV
ncbi:MAG TPA: amino acid permease [Bacillus sp. (in: firmicutes)]|nr:amino acid permease [Bacillus sp. (in: firmicutes)]